MPPSKDPKKRAKQLAGLRKGNTPRNPQLPAPRRTRDHALAFAKLTQAGIPPFDALTMLFPDYLKSLHMTKRRQLAAEWRASKEVDDAITALVGTPWAEMDATDRLVLARDKHLAQAAYFLFTNDYASINDPDQLRKLQDARSAIIAHLRDDEDGDQNSPFNQLIQRMLKSELQKDVELDPPTWSGAVPVEMVAPDRES